MVFSQARGLLRTAQLFKQNVSVLNKHAVKNGHGSWAYRRAPDLPPKLDLYMAEAIGGLMWWWILWHLYTQFDHVVGEFDYPDARKWTDEELGIPPLE